LLQPIQIIGPQPKPCNEALDYDSEEEERRERIKKIEEVRKRANVPSDEEDEDKMLLCAMCETPLVTVSTLTPMPGMRNTFKLTKSFMAVFIGGDEASGFVSTCRNSHTIGGCVYGAKYINEYSKIVIRLQGGRIVPWRPEIWQNNFAAIGGPISAAVEARPKIDFESKVMCYCGVCDFQCKNRAQFINHVNSAKHKDQERYSLEL